MAPWASKSSLHSGDSRIIRERPFTTHTVSKPPPPSEPEISPPLSIVIGPFAIELPSLPSKKSLLQKYPRLRARFPYRASGDTSWRRRDRVKKAIVNWPVWNLICSRIRTSGYDVRKLDHLHHYQRKVRGLLRKHGVHLDMAPHFYKYTTQRKNVEVQIQRLSQMFQDARDNGPPRLVQGASVIQPSLDPSGTPRTRSCNE